MFETLAYIGFLTLKRFTKQLPRITAIIRQYVYILQTITVSPLSHISNINFSLVMSCVRGKFKEFEQRDIEDSHGKLKT